MAGICRFGDGAAAVATAQGKGAAFAAPSRRKWFAGRGTCRGSANPGPLPVELRARLDDARVVAQSLALAVDLHAVQRELEVGAPVPFHAGRPRVHLAAFYRAILEPEGGVASDQLPHAAAWQVGRRGGPP